MDILASPALSSRSINIPRLALDAANELDDVENGRRKESPSAKQLGTLIVNSFRNGKPATQVTATSGTVAVFCSALERLGSGAKINDFGQLLATAQRYAAQLNGKKVPGGKSAIEEAKNFCIALAKAATGYRESVIGAQARNRWR